MLKTRLMLSQMMTLLAQSNKEWSVWFGGGAYGRKSGFPRYLENLENLEFCHLHFQTWKMPGICSKSGKNGLNV